MATAERSDPYRAFNFQLEIDGVPLGAFSEASGLTADGDAVDYREGTDLQSQRAQAGRACASTRTSRSSAATRRTSSLWHWYQNIANGQPDRRNVTIVLMNEARQPVLRWHAENAWINKIEGPSFKASGNEVAMESVELVHEGLTIEAAA